MSLPYRSHSTVGFDNFLTQIMGRPVTAASVRATAQALGAVDVTESYLDAATAPHNAPATAPAGAMAAA